MNLRIAQKDFSEGTQSYLFAVTRDRENLTVLLSTGYMFFFPSKHVHACCRWCMYLVVVIGCAHPCCPVCSSLPPGTGGCIKGVWDDGRKESWAQVECGCGHTSMLPRRALARRSVRQPTPSCSPRCPAVTSRSKSLVLHSHFQWAGGTQHQAVH